MSESDQKTIRGHDIQVPLDHSNPDLGTGSIYYEFGGTFDKTKPVVIVIADAQQFYIREGEVAKFQERWFGDAFNVLGIVGRGTSPEFIQTTIGDDEKPDWMKAWKIFNYSQWLADIDAIRQAVLGADGQILIYGESGGAMLAHQYLAEYGRHVSRAFTRAVVNPYLVGQLGLNSDRFWKEVGEYDPDLHQELEKAFEHYDAERSVLVMTLQRQNFFVPPEKLADARAELIRALAAGDEEYFAKVRQEYEVDAVNEIMRSTEAIPIRVRLFEFLAPTGARERLGGTKLYPDYEVAVNIAEPLINLADSGDITPGAFPFRNLHDLETEVFVLSGRWDHVVDYRSSIALAASYPKGYLFLADDDHMFKGFEESGLLAPLLQQFLHKGLGTKEFQTAVSNAAPHRWREP